MTLLEVQSLQQDLKILLKKAHLTLKKFIASASTEIEKVEVVPREH
jgi:hypothetical protein